MNSHFFAYIYRLRYIERWSLMRNVVKENVAEHSYNVAMLTHALCTIANEVYGKQLPTEHIVTSALFHDASEVITGDIPTPVKHHNTDILNNFRDIEQKAAQQLVDMIPEQLRSVYQPLIMGKHNQNRVQKYVKAADLLDAYLKCSTELSAGNREFTVAQKQIAEKIKKMDMPEVQYFLKHFAPSFEKTIDELT